MSAEKIALESCPVGEDSCLWLDELKKLRQENEKLKLMVTTDPLTGLFNYRYFEEILTSELERTNRSARPTCLVMIDIDHFKQVNDQYGHEAGNLALKTAANVFKQDLRVFDIVCRYGGEEFALILPQTALPIAVNVAERVRLRLENTPVAFEGDEINLTASFGVGIYQYQSDFTQKSFIEQVDHLMYQAKQQGRNQVCHPDYASLKPATSVSAEERSALFRRDNETPTTDKE